VIFLRCMSSDLDLIKDDEEIVSDGDDATGLIDFP
jgi:hypothetical protein